MKRTTLTIVLFFALAAGTNVAEAGWCKDCQYLEELAFCSLVYAAVERDLGILELEPGASLAGFVVSVDRDPGGCLIEASALPGAPTDDEVAAGRATFDLTLEKRP